MGGPLRGSRLDLTVNYQLAIPGRARKLCIVHVNMLRPWNTPDARVLRVVVAEEDEDEHTTVPSPSDSNLDVEQKAKLDTLLDSFSEVIHTTPGRASLVEHVINTSNSPPLRTAPYPLQQLWSEHSKWRMSSDTLRTLYVVFPFSLSLQKMTPSCSRLMPRDRHWSHAKC